MNQLLTHCSEHYHSQHSFIHSGYFYSASSSPLLLRGSPNYSIDSLLCRSSHAEALCTGNYE